MKVHILLSTYNGERFLAEQLRSIQAQTYQDWELLIRDDGSTDGTLAVIDAFVQSDSRIRLITPEDRTNVGVIQSFHRLLTYEQADFYFFSDQDDYWLKDKLTLCLAAAQEEDATRPLLVYTDLKVVDQDLQVMKESMIRSQSHHANTCLRTELTENTVTGGTVLINHALATLWKGTENILMHDWYLALVAAACGRLVYLDQPTQLYRQHADNVLGARTLSKRMKKWLRPHHLFATYWELIQKSQQQAIHLLDLPLQTKDRQLVTDFVQLMTYPFWERIKLLYRHGLRKNRVFHTLVFTSLITTKFAYKNRKNRRIHEFF